MQESVTDFIKKKKRAGQKKGFRPEPEAFSSQRFNYLAFELLLEWL
jgi:hypothetical protein